MNRLLQLFADNRAANKAVRGQSRLVAAGDEATLYIYEAIVADDATAEWWGGVSAQSLAPQIRAITARTLHLRINSPGGDVFAAQAIAQAIRDTKARVVAHVDGYAASAATEIAIAADEIEIAEGGFFMIHNAWTIMMGNSAELRAEADLLDSLDAEIVRDYQSKTGKTEQQLQDWMKAETWFNADQAKENGFVDSVIETTANPSNRWNLAAYSNVPKDLIEPARPNRAMLERRLQLLEACSA